MIKFIKRFLKKEDDGFSLMEVVVAMGVFAISLLSLVQVFYYSTMLNTRAKQLSTAANVARREMDSIRLMSMAELDDLQAEASGWTDGELPLDVDRDGTDDFDLSVDIQKLALPVGENYFRYTVELTVTAKAMAVSVGLEDVYKLRTVLIRNTEDQNKI